jgi:predicted protein tyrosine phosphatase
MNVLFVCTQAVARSPMAALLFRQLLGDDARHQARVAGTAPYALTRLATRTLAWADLVAVMEETHRQEIRALWPDHAHKVVVLGVPDDFDPGDPELRKTLAPKIQVILEEVLKP